MCLTLLETLKTGFVMSRPIYNSHKCSLRSARTVKATFGMQSTVAVYNNRVFGGWDYAITNPKAAIVKKANLRREFKVGKHLL